MQFLEQALPEGTAIYSASVAPAGDGYHFEVVLDGLTDPRGAVSVADCDRFSERLVELLDAGGSTLPPDLTAENYSLEVSSAGAERKLRLPEDLSRFTGLPLRLHFTKDGVRHNELVTFGGEDPAGVYRFQEYIPRRKRNRTGPKGRARNFFGARGVEAVELKLEEMEHGNLYLDF